MKIESKNWTARDDRMPGVNTLRVSGTVTVTASNVTPVLVPSTAPHAGNVLVLNLQLESDGFGAQVLTEKQVTYTQPSNEAITAVTIYHECELLASIENIEVTH